MAPAVILFCKYPIPGQVKTRLAASIGNQRAVAVYRHLVHATLTCTAGVNRFSEVLVFFAPSTEADRIQEWLGRELRYHPQCDGDLGDRLMHAFRFATESAPRPTLVIGTDCPELTSAHLRRAFGRLEDHDLVLGPTCDGGYYLIGARRTHPELFRDMPWSTDALWEATLRRACQARLKVATLPRLRDIDTLADLESVCLAYPNSPLAEILRDGAH